MNKELLQKIINVITQQFLGADINIALIVFFVIIVEAFKDAIEKSRPKRKKISSFSLLVFDSCFAFLFSLMHFVTHGFKNFTLETAIILFMFNLGLIIGIYKVYKIITGTVLKRFLKKEDSK